MLSLSKKILQGVDTDCSSYRLIVSVTGGLFQLQVDCSSYRLVVNKFRFVPSYTLSQWSNIISSSSIVDPAVPSALGPSTGWLMPICGLHDASFVHSDCCNCFRSWSQKIRLLVASHSSMAQTAVNHMKPCKWELWMLGAHSCQICGQYNELTSWVSFHHHYQVPCQLEGANMLSFSTSCNLQQHGSIHVWLLFPCRDERLSRAFSCCLHLSHFP